MKCPKCGYNSFEYYDNCKKCANDLTGYKQTYSISSIVLPDEIKEMKAAAFSDADSVTASRIDASETNDDMFAFDLADDSSDKPSVTNNDPFNFDEPEEAATAFNKPVPVMEDDSVFGDLLESTSQSDESPFGSSQSTQTQSNVTGSTSGSGEFDLEGFSWDDNSSSTAEETPKVEDDFDSLFGDMTDKESK